VIDLLIIKGLAYVVIRAVGLGRMAPGDNQRALSKLADFLAVVPHTICLLIQFRWHIKSHFELLHFAFVSLYFSTSLQISIQIVRIMSNDKMRLKLL
jgi:hypothetical protein